MKRIIALLSFFFMSSVQCQEISESVLIKDLPPGLAIMVKKEIRSRDGGPPFYYFYKYDYSKKLDTSSGFTIRCKSSYYFTPNEKFPKLLYVNRVRPFVLPSSSGDYVFSWNTITFYFTSDDNPKSDECEFEINALDNAMPLTVKDALKYAEGYISFIDSDPYAKLDDDTALKIIMKKITDAVASGRYKESLLSFSMLERRKIDLPEEFYYFYAQALKNTDNKDKAMEYSTKYLSKYGKKGKYYEKVTDLIASL